MYHKIFGTRKGVAALALASCFAIYAYSDKESLATAPVNTTPNASAVITKKPATTYQEMIGFGGALTWYSDRVVNSSKSEKLYQLMFQDLGMDILCLKNWHAPLDYPANKSAEIILTTGDATILEATNTFYRKANALNPDTRMLLSAWGPPPALKSNNHLREGTLKQDANGYMHEEFATYWADILDNIAFDPDYISIRNEPGYVNAGWTTCRWSPTETAMLAGYEQAFEQVYQQIKDREDAPVMIGAEPENVPAFLNFAPVVKDKDYCPIYAYHPYNFNAGTNISQTTALLSELQSRSGEKPDIMTDYSSLQWFKTARFIHQTMKHAHTSGYIYRELVWGDANTKDKAMIYIDGSGNYTINPFYPVIKHFAKLISAGRMHPDQNKLTLVIINPDARTYDYEMEVAGKEVNGEEGYQSVEGDLYKSQGSITADGTVKIPTSSITMLVLDI